MYIGIDLGGTNIAAGVVDKYGKLLYRDSVKFKAGRHFSEVIKDMAHLAMKITVDAGFELSDVEWVGIGSPGTCDIKNGILIYANNLGFYDVPISDEFRKHFDVPVYIANDADAAAYGEAMAGAAKDVSDSVMVTLGTGVGGGVIIGKKLYNGFNNAGAELGHMIICHGGKKCTCGIDGCWEAYASATALISQTKESMEENPHSLMHKIAKSEGGVSAKTAFDAAKAGDAAGRTVVDNYVKYLSLGIINIVNIFMPEKIIIGGGVSNEKDYLIEPVKEYIRDRVYCKTGNISRIEIAKLGNDAGIIGAAFLGRQYISEV